ncbi:hypothetical protein ACFLSY_09345 [Bacteroidota bacterium]
MNKLKNTQKVEKTVDEISRKEALKKAGKYAVFTAATMLFLFSPKEAQAVSTPQPPGGGW